MDSYRKPSAVPGSHRRSRRRSPLTLLLLLLFWSIILGIGLAQATTPPAVPTGTVDRVPERYQVGQDIYLQTCSTCHIAPPPAVFPTETWRNLIEDPQHYGTEITPPTDPYRLALWNYLSVYSRPLNKGESTPFRFYQSRYFKALHPRVEFTERPSLPSCVSCHPGAPQFDFRSLTPEWQDAP